MNRPLLDVSHTSHTHAQTGIQRLARALCGALREKSGDISPVCYDPYESGWRLLCPWERANLAPPRGRLSGTRGARWPLTAKIAGRLRRLRARWTNAPASGLSGDCFLELEIFSPVVGRALPAVFAGVSGPRIALFHDAIALQLPELSPPKTVARYPAYLQELLLFDGIAAISEDSQAALVNYWRWLGVKDAPPVAGIPLGVNPPVPAPFGHTTAMRAAPRVLSVGSIEGRKNHVALLEACEALWQRGRRFELQLIGLAHPQTGRTALARLRALEAAGRPVQYEGPVSDGALARAYRACAFTVYPSLREGFGLPVLESMSYKKPCISSALGALGESTRGGGCLALERVNAPALAAAIDSLLSDPGRLEALSLEAQRRPLKTWSAYADEILAWMQSLPRRDR